MSGRHLWVCSRVMLGILLWGSLAVGAMAAAAAAVQPGQAPFVMAGLLVLGVVGFAFALRAALVSARRLDALLDVDPSARPPREWVWARLKRVRFCVLPYDDDPARYHGMSELEWQRMHTAIADRLIAESVKVLQPYGGRVYGVRVVIPENGGGRPWTPEAYAEVQRLLAEIPDQDLRPRRRLFPGGSR